MAALSANWQHCASATPTGPTPDVGRCGRGRHICVHARNMNKDAYSAQWRAGEKRSERSRYPPLERHHHDRQGEEEEAVGQMASLPRARESVRAIAIIDFPFFPTAGNASLADLTLHPARRRLRRLLPGDDHKNVLQHDWLRGYRHRSLSKDGNAEIKVI